MLAIRCRRSPQDVWYHWRSEAETGSPKRLLQWVLLVHATVGRPHGASSERMASRLGTTPQTLRRAAQSVLSTTLSHATRNHGAAVVEAMHVRLAECFRLAGYGSPGSGLGIGR